MAIRDDFEIVAGQVRAVVQRFALVLLVVTAFGAMLIGKADTVLVEQARVWALDLASPALEAIARPVAATNCTAAPCRRNSSPISVAQAALAEEQVLSTRMQLVLGLPGIRAWDLLLAYNDSREALVAMVGLLPAALSHGIGSETQNSIQTPASQSGVVGVKPTVGLVSRAGVVPLAIATGAASRFTTLREDASLAAFYLVSLALGVTLVFFIVFFNTHRGVREVDPVLVSNARMLGANEWQLSRHVLLPSALSWVFSSLNVSVGFAMIAVVVGVHVDEAGQHCASLRINPCDSIRVRTVTTATNPRDSTIGNQHRGIGDQAEW